MSKSHIARLPPAPFLSCKMAHLRSATGAMINFSATCSTWQACTIPLHLLSSWNLKNLRSPFSLLPKQLTCFPYELAGLKILFEVNLFVTHSSWQNNMVSCHFKLCQEFASLKSEVRQRGTLVTLHNGRNEINSLLPMYGP